MFPGARDLQLCYNEALVCTTVRRAKQRVYITPFPKEARPRATRARQKNSRRRRRRREEEEEEEEEREREREREREKRERERKKKKKKKTDGIIKTKLLNDQNQILTHWIIKTKLFLKSQA